MGKQIKFLECFSKRKWTLMLPLLFTSECQIIFQNAANLLFPSQSFCKSY